MSIKNMWVNAWGHVSKALGYSPASNIVFWFLSAYFIIDCPIEFIAKPLFLLISIIVGMNVGKLRFNQYTTLYSFLFLLLALYITFAIFGYDTFIYHKDAIRLMSLFHFFLGFIWTTYVLQATVDVFHRLNSIEVKRIKLVRSDYWRKWLIVFVLLVASFLLYHVAYNPAIISPDSHAGLGHRIGNPLSDWHPALHSLMVAFIMQITSGVEYVIYIQIVAFASMLATCLMYIHKIGMQYRHIIPFSVGLPLIPSIGLHGNTVWKDVPFAISMLWLTYIIVIILNEVINQRKISRNSIISISIQLCLSLILVYFLRANGFLVLYMVAPCVSVLFFIHKQWKLLASIAVSIVLVLLIQFPFYRTMNVYQPEFKRQAKYFALVHDIQAVYYDGASLSEKSLAILNRSIPNLDEHKKSFRRDWVLHDTYDFSELTMREFISMYVDAFIHRPIAIIRAILTRTRAYWVIAPKERIGTVNSTRIYDPSSKKNATQSPYINAYRKSNVLTKFFQNEWLPIMNGPLTASFVWRFGFWVTMLLICAFFSLMNNNHLYLLAFAPVFVYLITILLANGWSDYRYGLSVFLISMFLIPCTIINNGKSNSVSESNDKEKAT